MPQGVADDSDSNTVTHLITVILDGSNSSWHSGGTKFSLSLWFQSTVHYQPAEKKKKKIS